MFKKLLITLGVLIFGFFAPSVVAAVELDLPDPVGFVNDLENIIDNDDELEEKLSNYQKTSSNEIAVLTVSDFQGVTIEEYAVEVFEEWGIGTDENDNGVLILVSSAQRQSRIEVGYGLEGALPDALTGRIQDNEMIPFFREGDYSTGISAGVDAVLSATKGEYVMEDIPVDTEGFEIVAFIIMIIFLIILFKIFRIFPSAPVIGGVARMSGFSTPSSFGRSSGSRRSSSGFGGFGGGRSGGGGSSRSW